MSFRVLNKFSSSARTAFASCSGPERFWSHRCSNWAISWHWAVMASAVRMISSSVRAEAVDANNCSATWGILAEPESQHERRAPVMRPKVRVGHTCEGQVPRQPRAREWALTGGAYQWRRQHGGNPLPQGLIQCKPHSAHLLLPADLPQSGEKPLASTSTGAGRGRRYGRSAGSWGKMASARLHELETNIASRG